MEKGEKKGKKKGEKTVERKGRKNGYALSGSRVKSAGRRAPTFLGQVCHPPGSNFGCFCLGWIKLWLSTLIVSMLAIDCP